MTTLTFNSNEGMIDITKLKMGDRVQFAPNTLAICSSPTFETDVSNLKGTVVNFDKPFNANTFTHVWIELDIKHEEFDCDEWGNAIQFNLFEDGEHDGGTSVHYLKQAKLIEEQS